MFRSIATGGRPVMLLLAMTARVFFACAVLWVSLAAAQTPAPKHEPDVPFVTTPQFVVDAMLDLAAVKPEDVVYDLGCGDGRIVISAAAQYHAHAVCIEIDPELVARARKNAVQQGVEKMIDFRQADFFQADIHDATVVTL